MKNILQKCGIFLIAILVMKTIYSLVSQWTLASSYNTSLLTPIDVWIPLIPWTVLIYMSAYPFWLAPIFFKNITPRIFVKMILITAIAFCFSALGHIFLPSAYPRPEISEVVAQHNWSEYLLKHFVYLLDPPNNTFPSLHVITVAILLIMMNKKMSKWGYRLYLLWGMAIIVSVLTVKQHYFLDVVAALAIVFGIRHAVKLYKKHLVEKHKPVMPDLIDDLDDIQ